MKVSFDLDGVVCSTDWGYLDALRERGMPKDEEEKYYACLEKWIDPYRFLGVDDEVVILTGRPYHLKEITEKWLKKNGMGDIPVIFTKTLTGVPKATKEEFKALGEAKAKFFIDEKIDVHFDDNEQVVKAMREAFPDMVVIHTGWHVAW